MTTVERILAVLAEKGLNYSDAAHAAGLSRQAISRWASGKSVPRDESINKLAKALRVDRSRLVETGRTTPPVLVIRKDGAQEVRIILDAPTTITVSPG